MDQLLRLTFTKRILFSATKVSLVVGTLQLIKGKCLNLNAFIKSFDNRFRQERLNTHWFLSPDDTKPKIEA